MFRTLNLVLQLQIKVAKR